MPRDTRLRKYSRGRSRSRSPECDKTRNFKSLAHSADVPDKDRRAGHTKISRSRSSSRRRVRSSSRSRRSRSRSPLHRRHEESDKRRKRRRRSRSSSSAATSSSESDSLSSTDSSNSLDGRRNQNHRRHHHHHSHKHKHKHKHKRHDKHKHHHKHKHHRKKHKKQHPRVDPLVKAYEDQVIREIKEWQQQQHQAKEKRGSGDSGCPVDDGPSIPWSSELHNEEQKESTMPKRPPMMPQTKQEYDAEQSVVREVVDPIDGRVRLIKGTGEVLERIVSREEHLQINKQATIGDGLTYQRRWMGGGG